jgi:tetratricopeptide (TPR) repeat protein
MLRILSVLVAILLVGCADSGPRPPKSTEEARWQLTRQIESGNLAGRALAEAHLARGALWLRSNDAGRAQADFEAAVAAAPDFGITYLARGHLRSALGNFDAAAADATQAIALLPPDNPEGQLLRAEARRAAGDPAAAIPDLDEALARDPQRWQLYGLRGLALADMGEEERAFADLSRAIALDPGHIGMQKVRKGMQSGGMPNPTYWIVEEPISSAEFIEPVRTARGRIHFARGQYAEAVADFDDIFYTNDAYVQRGLAKMALGQCQEGYRDIRWYAGRNDLSRQAIFDEHRAFIAETGCTVD